MKNRIIIINANGKSKVIDPAEYIILHRDSGGVDVEIIGGCSVAFIEQCIDNDVLEQTLDKAKQVKNEKE